MPYTGIKRHHQVIYDSRERFQERFWKYVSRTDYYDDHWVWTGPVDNTTGHSIFTINNVVIPVLALTPLWDENYVYNLTNYKQTIFCYPTACINPFHQPTGVKSPASILADTINTIVKVLFLNPFQQIEYKVLSVNVPTGVLSATDKTTIQLLYLTRLYSAVDLAEIFNVKVAYVYTIISKIPT